MFDLQIFHRQRVISIGPKGLHFKSLLIVNKAASRGEYNEKACFEYSEQDG
jgi:hypothetical protein